MSALMLLVMVTLQTILSPPTFAELLHWLTVVTRSVELMTKVPLPPGQGSMAQFRCSVVTELVMPPLMVLTIVTSHSTTVEAPPGPGPMPLHWNCDGAAEAGAASRINATKENAVERTATSSTAARDLRLLTLVCGQIACSPIPLLPSLKARTANQPDGPHAQKSGNLS